MPDMRHALVEPQREAAPQPSTSYEELVAELPESNKLCELWDGEVVMSPAPSFLHQEIVFRFHSLLMHWVGPRDLGRVVGAPIDMVLSEHRAIQPDVLFVAKPRLSIIRRVVNGPADLVAEVVSLGSRNRDRIEKRDLYEQHGINEYWIVDPEPQTVEVLSLQNQRYELTGRWRPGETAASRLLPGFTVPVAPLFADLVGEP
jgi:Uma2 family endonuclease